ncbi:MAG: endospore germination permease [Peptococcaceae bacterium]|nr:endospore germination permease [Peptococcaceae bacterium]
MPKVTVRISSRQLMLLKLTGITGTIFFGAVRLLTTMAGAHAYLAILGGGVASWTVIFLATRIAQRFPAETPFEYAQIIFGKWFGKLFGFALISFNLVAASLILRSLGDFLITAILPQTPLSVNITLMLVLICVGTYLGLEALARFNEAFYPFIFLSWVLVLAASVPRLDFGWFRPLFDIGPGQLTSATIVAGTFLIDSLVVLVFYPFVTDKKVVLKYTTWSVVMGTILVLLLQGAVIGVFSPNLANTLTFPLLELAQDASLGVFLERIEALYLAIWVVGTFIRVAVVFYAAVLGLAQTLGIKDHRIFIPLLVVPVFYLSFQADNVPMSFNYDSLFSHYGIFIQFGFVISLLLGAMFRGKRGRADSESKSV